MTTMTTMTALILLDTASTLADTATSIVESATTAVDPTETSRNNAALPLAVGAMGVLGALAFSAPKWARRINDRKNR